MSAVQLRTITETAPLIKTGALSPVDLVRSCLARIDARPELNAFITVMRDQALKDAEQAVTALSAGRWLGPLHGIPVSVKDLVDVAGTPTTSGSNVPARVPHTDAPIVRQLRAAGAIVIGKTNLHEFAFGTTSDETAFGAVRHPLDPSRSPGGSSGGAAAALLEGMCLGAIGTDTGGSIRIPAAACGVVGLKPTLGELTCEGVVPLSTTLDHVGPLALTVSDAALLYQAMKPSPLRGVIRPAGPLAFGVPRPYFFDRLEPSARQLTEQYLGRLREAGHSVIDMSIDGAKWTADVYLHICLPEASEYHAASLSAHADRYSPGVRLRLEMGRYLLAEDYVRAARLRQSLISAVDRALERLDALVLPALPIPAPPIGAGTVDVDGTPMPVRATMLRLTQLFNITGHPAVALPAGLGPDGLPRSLQIVGRRGNTERLLDIAAAVESVL
jgi:aspartyl-tRNA(Asn)/glutamyl-tRNA(Gln) amidotransferase subunit A